jgi:hypothetical protein
MACRQPALAGVPNFPPTPFPRQEVTMAAHPKDPQQPREAAPEQTPQKHADNADQAKEGMPGYGQPPKEVRKPLPDQKW